MTNLFSTRQLTRQYDSIKVDLLIYVKSSIVLTMFFSLISAGALATLLVITDNSGWSFYVLFLVMLGAREYVKRKYTKHILAVSEDSPLIEILDLMKLRDRFGVSLIENALMWVSAGTARSYLPILIMSLFTILRMAFQYSRFKKANTPVLPK